ncbi:M23 family metallopeptidase [Natranaerofaba carboxydovora]|uniref:M23 family metallopeptidase n=1 Tax=Natranaerofaba carboxydovora TaxID=2742683 RepID=UPI001F1463B1|nr:M23 family metallopeptidase [Natranaerofaba carboxydovora]UMZ75096.1 Murein DD-endopeptidase MepM [Natranaerofaba carboxydovora]
MKKLILAAKEKILNFLSQLKRKFYSLKTKIKNTSKRRLIITTYIIVLAISIGIINFGYRPGQFTNDEITFDEEEIEDDKREISIFEPEEDKLDLEVDKKEPNKKEDREEVREEDSGEKLDKETKEDDELQETKEEYDSHDQKEADVKEEEEQEVVAKSIEQIPTGIWPVEGEIITEHNEIYQINNQYKVHKGIDIRAPRGTEVLSFSDGEVKQIKKQEEFGVMVIISHETFFSSYSNLEEGIVDEDDYVSEGEVIGYVGEDAKLDAARGSFLHFEVYSDEKNFDPEAILE